MQNAHAWAIPFIVLLAAIAAPGGARAETPAAVSVGFSGEVFVSADTAVMTFSGTAIASQDRMRIDVLQHELGEEVNIIVDFEAGNLVALYPDTLNGARYGLAQFDYIGGFSRIRDSLLGLNPHAPAGWEESAGERVELDGAQSTRRQAVSADGLTITWWTSPAGLPQRAQAQKKGTLVILEVTSYEPLPEVDSALFVIPEDYTITAAADDIPEGMPPL
jgi:hypothetical protein